MVDRTGQAGDKETGVPQFEVTLEMIETALLDCEDLNLLPGRAKVLAAAIHRDATRQTEPGAGVRGRLPECQTSPRHP